MFQVRIVDARHENEEGGPETNISSAVRRTTASISHEDGVKGHKPNRSNWGNLLRFFVLLMVN